MMRLVRRWVVRYLGMYTNRSTATTTVFCMRFETT